MTSGVHDIGGVLQNLEKFSIAERECFQWEKEVHATLVLLTNKHLLTTDEQRRAIEALPGYENMSYYHRWSAAMLGICVERGTFTTADVDQHLGNVLRSKTSPDYQAGDKVRVREENSLVRWRKPHLRVPGYVFGVSGIVERYLGNFPNPEQKAFNNSTEITLQPLYLVRVEMSELWRNDPVHLAGDYLTLEVYEPWLEQVSEAKSHDANIMTEFSGNSSTVDHGDHHHDNRLDTEVESLRREEADGEDPVGEAFARALNNILVAKGILTRDEIRGLVESMDARGRMQHGRHLVAEAWTNPQFKARLLEDGNAAAGELGVEASNPNTPTKLIVIENTPQEHHFVVCTLCSCYPSALLGVSPAWYRSRSYRARAVREPRKLLAEFGLNLDPSVRIVVHDSTADCRYLILPVRPKGTEGLTKKELAQVITRDSMIGVSVPKYTPET